MEKLANTEVIEASSLYLDLSESLLNKIDLFLSNTNLTKREQQDLIKIFQLIYSEGYTEAITD